MGYGFLFTKRVFGTINFYKAIKRSITDQTLILSETDKWINNQSLGWWYSLENRKYNAKNYKKEV